MAHAILVIIWNVLASRKPYNALGSGYFDRRIDPEREAQPLIARRAVVSNAQMAPAGLGGFSSTDRRV